MKPIDSGARKAVRPSKSKTLPEAKQKNLDHLNSLLRSKRCRIVPPTKGVRCRECGRVVLESQEVQLGHLEREHGLKPMAEELSEFFVAQSSNE